MLKSEKTEGCGRVTRLTNWAWNNTLVTAGAGLGALTLFCQSVLLRSTTGWLWLALLAVSIALAKVSVDGFLTGLWRLRDGRYLVVNRASNQYTGWWMFRGEDVLMISDTGEKRGVPYLTLITRKDRIVLPVAARGSSIYLSSRDGVLAEFPEARNLIGDRDE